jgi:hypothetical protein
VQFLRVVCVNLVDGIQSLSIGQSITGQRRGKCVNGGYMYAYMYACVFYLRREKRRLDGADMILEEVRVRK